MHIFRIYGGWVLIACSVLVTCKFEAAPPSANLQSGGSPTAQGGRGSGGSDRADSGGKSTGGRAGAASAGESGAQSVENAGASGDVGSTGLIGGAGSGSVAGGPDGGNLAVGGAGTEQTGGTLGVIMPDCDPESGDCGTPSSCATQTAVCTIVSASNACEIALTVGESATVACGSVATVRTVSCGGCTEVAVKVYFDGKHCWEGLPDCPLDEYAGKFFGPHAP